MLHFWRMTAQTQQQGFAPARPSPSKLFTPAVSAILILMVVGYTLSCYVPDFTAAALLLNPNSVIRGTVWQLITFSLINSPCNLAFSALAILFLGSMVEREWRTPSFVLLWVVVSAVCGLLWTVVGLVMGMTIIGSGSTPCVYGLIGAFGLLFRGKRFRFLFGTILAQHLALIFIGIGLVLGIAQPLSWIWIAGAGVAYLYIKLRWRLMRGPSAATRGKRDSFVDVD